MSQNNLVLICDANAASEVPVQWARARLTRILEEKNLPVVFAESFDGLSDGVAVVLALTNSPTAHKVLKQEGVTVPQTAEASALVRGRAENRPVLLATGADVRGMVYAILELADRLEHATNPMQALMDVDTVVETPANAIRGVMRLFTSELEDKPWFYDKRFWEQYLDMLASQRFNRFSLTLGIGYNYPYNFTKGPREAYLDFAYPFLVSAPGYDVRVRELPEGEREKNLETLRWIAGEVKRRGLHFQLGFWSQAYEWPSSPEANYSIVGLSPENHAVYCRDALRALLDACPSIDGLTFRIHYESGIPEGTHAFWKTVFEGVTLGDRRLELDLHAKGVDYELIDLALGTGNRVNVSPKYWAEHMGLPYHQASIRESERQTEVGEHANAQGARRFMRYGYGDLLKKDRDYGIIYRIWPGTQRFLLWGDPVMTAAYARFGSFGGGAGVELFEPLSFKGRKASGKEGGRELYADPSLRLGLDDWKKYAYTYRLWGRLLYNPDSDPAVWQRYLLKELGAAATAAEKALSYASRILPLLTTAHLPSGANDHYWPEMYINMSIVDADKPHPYNDTPSPKRFGTVSAIDPALFARVEDYADALTDREPSAKYSPLAVAQWLEELANRAEQELAHAPSADAPAYRRLAVDVLVQTELGRFFARKLRAGLAYALYQRTKDTAWLAEAVAQYEAARAVWQQLIATTDGIYIDDIAFGSEPYLRGHWRDRLAAIDDDVADMRRELEEAGVAETLIRHEAKLPEARHGYEHSPPASFRRGEQVRLELAFTIRPLRVKLHYRHVNQVEGYQSVEMQGETWLAATIPADYTDSPYHLMYFFEVHDGEGRAWMCPGFAENLSNQPYFVIEQA